LTVLTAARCIEGIGCAGFGVKRFYRWRKRDRSGDDYKRFNHAAFNPSSLNVKMPFVGD
jgi:hypothetical protein